jgi:hypothetical protein
MPKPTDAHPQRSTAIPVAELSAWASVSVMLRLALVLRSAAQLGILPSLLSVTESVLSNTIRVTLPATVDVGRAQLVVRTEAYTTTASCVHASRRAF